MAEETTYKYYAFTADTLLAHDQELVKKTKEYVDANGGKINTIKVNGEAQAIESGKVVNIKVPAKTSDLTNDSNFVTSDQIPAGVAASTIVPKMDGTASVGADPGFARGDHIHPTDTSRASKTDVDALSGRLATAETKLSGVESGAEVNTIKGIQKNGADLTIDSVTKKVNVEVPTKVSELTNDSGYTTTEQVDGLIENYGYQTITGGRADISEHNTSTKAHADIRESVSNLNTKLGAFLDSDDETLDQLSELITAIKANQGSIASLTTGKVNTADVKVWTAAEVQSIVDSAWA